MIASLRLEAIGLFGIVPVDRPLQLFLRRRAIALFGIERSIALYYFFTAGDRYFWHRKVDRP